jgi:hypothetical protein
MGPSDLNPPNTLNHQRNCPRMEAALISAFDWSAPAQKQGLMISILYVSRITAFCLH